MSSLATTTPTSGDSPMTGPAAEARPLADLDPSTPFVRIQPIRGWVALKLQEVWQYRELLFYLAQRDIKVRYKQTTLGPTWAIIQPVMAMVAFTLFFNGLLNVGTGGSKVPYPVMCFSGLIVWNLFASGLNNAAASLVGSAGLITKVYFPRLALPIASLLVGIVDFLISFVILLGMMLFFHRFPTANVVWLPVYLLLALMTALGVGLCLAALNVRFRDVRYIVGYLVQFWMLATPVVYPASKVAHAGKRILEIYNLNPMAQVVEGFRWALLGPREGPAPGVHLVVAFAIAAAFLVLGAVYFTRAETVFADVV